MQKQGIVFDRGINYNKKKTNIKPPIEPYRDIKPFKHKSIKTDIL